MRHACTPILVGVSSPVSEILLPSKMAKFPFLTMDYIVHGHQKIQSIGIDSKNSCKYKLMSNAFTPILVGVTFSVSEILLPSKTAKFSFLTIVHGHEKIQSIGIDSKNSCKYKLMSNAFTPILVGVTYSVSEILLPSKTANFPFLTMDYIVHGHQKIQSIGIDSKNSCKYKLMSNAFTPILVGVTCYLQKRSNFPFRPWTIVHGHQKIQSIGIDSKNSCKYKLMRHACTPILVGVTSSFLEILLP